MSNEEKDEQKEEEQENTKKKNVWQEFLSQQVGQSFQQGHLIVLGSAGCGKTTIVGQFGRLESKFGDMKRFLMMRYSYTYLENSSSNNSSSGPLLNIWQISEPKHCDVLFEVIPKEDQDKVCWMICLDISKPHLVEEEFNKWIKVCVETQEKLLARCDSRTQGELKDKLYELVSYYINPNDNEAIPVPEEEKQNLELKRDNPSTNIGAPLLTVLTKIDQFKNLYAAESEANSYYDILTQYVRLWNLQYGGASFSMCKGLKDQARRILRYIDHRIFGTRFNRGPSAVVSLTNLNEDFLFVPTGYDSKSMIEVQANTRNIEDPYSQHFKPQKDKTDNKQNKKYEIKSDKDSTFLKNLEWELNNVKNGNNNKLNSKHTDSKVTNDNNNGKDTEAVQKFFNRLLNTNTSTNN